MSSSLEKLVKNLSDNDFKYLTEEFGSKNLEFLKQKAAYPSSVNDPICSIFIFFIKNHYSHKDNDLFGF